MSFQLQASGIGMLGLVGFTAVTIATEQIGPTSEGLYTTEQAERGGDIYEETCSSCHGGITDFTPAMATLLGDRTFRSGWTGRPLGELFGMIQETMPQDNPATLSSTQTADLIAYILRGNRFPAGEIALTNDINALMEIPFGP